MTLTRVLLLIVCLGYNVIATPVQNQNDIGYNELEDYDTFADTSDQHEESEFPDMEKETMQSKLQNEEIDINEKYQEKDVIPDKEMVLQEVNDDNPLSQMQSIRNEKSENQNDIGYNELEDYDTFADTNDQHEESEFPDIEKETMQSQLQDKEIDTNEQYQEKEEIPDIEKEMILQEEVNDDNSISQIPSIRDEKNEKDNQTQNERVFSAAGIGCLRQKGRDKTNYFTTKYIVGGSGGDFRTINFNGERIGEVVRSLKVWVDKRTIRSIQVEITNGRRYTYGHKKGDESEKFYFEPGELLRSLEIWGNGKCGLAGRVAGLRFRTNKGRKFEVHSSGQRNGPYRPPIGSGILVGVQVRAGDDLDALGFLILRRVEKAILSNIRYPSLHTLALRTKPIRIDTVTYNNKHSSIASHYTLSGSKAITEKESWSTTKSLEKEVSAEFEVRGSALFIEKSAKLGVRVKVGLSGTRSRETTTTTTRSYNFQIDVPPRKTVEATATVFEGVINTPYTGTMKYFLETGITFQYNVRGTYKGVAVSQIVVTKTEI